MPQKVPFHDVRTVFLDRDGVINRKAPDGEYVATWETFDPLPGAAEAIARLNGSGRRVFVVTNQRGVSLGLYSCSDVEMVHRRLQHWLARWNARIDGFYFCPHDEGVCQCRKPLPGMLLQVIDEHPGVEAATSVIIGDSHSDIEAGKRLGMRAILIHGQPRSPATKSWTARADGHARSLAEAVNLLP